MSPQKVRRWTGRHTAATPAAAYAPIADITASTVSQLQPAGTYHTGELGTAAGPHTSFEATPLVVDGVMYLSTPRGKLIALDPDTGAERWVFDARVDPHLRFSDYNSRGVSTWLDSEAKTGSGQ